ncbi:uncharacterized protein LOC117566639 [Drosophila albomicans]|uniref:Uncharacterized protein LOC117566639 n=1 Tax=Drosophila albomicans TaxID=7291 RepID=A0A6P8WEL3_DROAB|nr:uncharacterized protein LOC117566639 [Drosophila albomicans]
MFCKVLTAVGIIIVFVFLFGCDAKRRWDYEPISVDPYTSDRDKLDVEFRIKRSPRGEYFFAGFVNFNYVMDETTMMEATAMRSQSGNDDDYTPVPWSIPKQNYEEFFKNFYENLVYKNFGGCSNFRAPADLFPWVNGNYSFSDCEVSGDGMPEIAPQGYYKINFNVTGEVEWGFESVCKIFDKLMP